MFYAIFNTVVYIVRCRSKKCLKLRGFPFIRIDPMATSPPLSRLHNITSPPDFVSSLFNSTLSEGHHLVPWGVDADLKRCLITDIEAAGGLAVVSVAQPCNSKRHLYGEKHTPLRQQVVNLVSKWKRLSALQFDAVKQQIRSSNPTTAEPKPQQKPETPRRLFPFHRPCQQVPVVQKRSTMTSQPWENIVFGPSKFFCCPFLQFTYISNHITVERKYDLLDPARPEDHREIILVPFQDHPNNGVLYNGFGLEIEGADFSMYRKGHYRAWLRGEHEIVVHLPVSRSSFIDPKSISSYDTQRTRLGGHSETYEVARMVVRNRILSNKSRQTYFLLVVFPDEFTLTNAVFTPHRTPFGEIDPQITPVEVGSQVSESRVIKGIVVDIAFAVTIVEDEPRRATAIATQNPQAESLDQAMSGMVFE